MDQNDNPIRLAILAELQARDWTPYRLHAECDRLSPGKVGQRAIYTFCTTGSEPKLGAVALMLEVLGLTISKR